VNILEMGGTRFVGKPLVEILRAQGHDLTLFTRGKQGLPHGVEHIRGDRSQAQDLEPLRDRSFDVIIDSSGRTLDDSRSVLTVTGAPRHRFLYVSSAGVYAAGDQWPIDEDSPLGPASRHAGKADTEAWLFTTMEEYWIKPCHARLGDALIGMCMFGPAFVVAACILLPTLFLAMRQQRAADMAAQQQKKK